MKKSWLPILPKKHQFYAQITLFIIVSAAFTGMLVGTDVYSEVQDGIVEVLCLSCLKLDPKTTKEFTFDTANNASHPDYVINNLSSGIVFLHYSEDACPGCDIMYPIIKDVLGVEFDKEGVHSTQITYETGNISYFYTNLDSKNATPALTDPFETYDIQDVNGLPMFTIISLGYDSGVIKPKFVTLYGTLGLDTDQKRFTMIESVVDDAFTLWNENIPGYDL